MKIQKSIVILKYIKIYLYKDFNGVEHEEAIIIKKELIKKQVGLLGPYKRKDLLALKQIVGEIVQIFTEIMNILKIQKAIKLILIQLVKNILDNFK